MNPGYLDIAGLKKKESYIPGFYRKDNLPSEYARYEKDSIPVNNIEEEYLRLKKEIDLDIKHDVGNSMYKEIRVDIKEDQWSLWSKFKRKCCRLTRTVYKILTIY